MDKWVQVPFHSVVEIFGSCAGLALAVLLLLQGADRKDACRHVWVPTALVAMGLLDGFHACVSPGNTFVWLHSSAVFFGGLLFATTWVPLPFAFGWRSQLLPGTAAAGALAFGILSIAFPSLPPVMVGDGVFSPFAVATNALGGILFLVGGARFLTRYRKQKDPGEAFFAAFCALNGAAGLWFSRSQLWDFDWWFWHAFRLLGYLSLLVYSFAMFQRNVRALREENLRRRRTEESLEEQMRLVKDSAQTYRMILRTTMDGFWMTDLEGRFVDMNDAYCSLIGYTREELLTMRIEDVEAAEKPEEVRRHVRKIVEVGSDRFETRHRRKDGRNVDIEVSVNYLKKDGGRMVVFLRDITERKKLEEQFLQAQKMEAVGRLAGGVAHDFNNFLTEIMGYAELAASALPADSPVRADLEEIKKTGERAGHLTHRLLAFARRQKIEPRVINLNDLLPDMQKMLKPLLSEKVELIVRTAPDLGRVKADPGQIEQVVMNLAVNARDAMPHGGKLILEAQNATSGEEYARTHLGMEPKDYVSIAVTDTGDGMTQEAKAHLFEPFFTTKEKGKGTGLGLATCYGIVKQAGGSINVYSESGKGTTIRIYLPRVEEEAVPLSKPKKADPLPRGDETILIVEDEPKLRQLAAKILRAQGYQVLEAPNGEEALRLARERACCEIHLFLTDLVLPKMSGRDLIEEVRARCPGARVVYTSGYTDEAAAELGELEPGTVFLQKPFTPETLARRVREVLDQQGG